MQPDLPWNVAGIPPEAREAARAAARREGLSVGEWLTRRIMRTFAEVADMAPMREAAPAARESAAMLDSVSRSENEAQSAYKRIEEQLRSVSRRLEATERSQTENNRAMSKTATEINIATREQAQAFDQLGAHVVSLGDRLSRVEQQSAQDGLKDAVRSLHQGLSRVADQIAQTANQSADQLTALAGNVESVSGRLVEQRAEAESTSRSLEQRIAMIDERVRAVERAAHSSADALERTIANIEKTHDDRNISTNEMQRQAATLAQLSDTLDRLNSRLSASEAQTSGTMARLEENVARLEAKGQDALLDRRLLGIEHALSDIAARLETTERSTQGNNGNLEDTMRTLAQRVDAADKRHRDALTELRSAVKSANGTLGGFETAAQQPQAAQPMPYAASGPQSAGAPILDLPPFPNSPGYQPPAQDPFAPPPFETGPLDSASSFGGSQFGADTFASAAAAQPAAPAGNESFIAAARRSARAANTEVAEPASSGFSWGSRRDKDAAAEPGEPKSKTRYLLIAGIAIFAMLAVAIGSYLSQMGSAPKEIRKPSNLNQLLAPKPATPPAAAYTPPLGEDATAGQPMSNTTPPPAPAQNKPINVPPATVKPVPDNAKPAEQPKAAAMTPSQKLTALANGGNMKAQAVLGFSYLDGTNGFTVNEAEGARWLERASNSGDAMAAYRLGTLYERGHGVPTNAKKADELYGIAAKKGNRKAMHNLAVAFAEGSGVAKNLQQASQWFTRAAEMGLSDSQFNLAVLYERGMGVKQSLTEAYKWYAIAAAGGDSESKARVDALATQLTPADKAAAQAAAQNFHAQPMDPAANTAPTATDILGG
ncbi:MAG: SEL1-like repeat protein [Proteobacteria bacterium]|nr:SEL1-like repeat protein [Pseudomonadota bacterium]